MSKLVIAFVGPAYNHWAPRFAASGLEVEQIAVPVLSPAGDDIQSGNLPQVEGVVYLVNARVGAVYAAHPAETRRQDVYVLPIGAAQDSSPVGLDFLMKI